MHKIADLLSTSGISFSKSSKFLAQTQIFANNLARFAIDGRPVSSILSSRSLGNALEVMTVGYQPTRFVKYVPHVKPILPPPRVPLSPSQNTVLR